ncbi:MAG TPA: SIMPL domain-containing protein [Mycobacterium sp.]|nr:SIMPL domain-containing protein [Mycobacterium sp.]HTX93856.1 SIMPL domain-containing protein [Mycobacterium sp.]
MREELYRSMKVTGTGRVSARPDILSLSLAVETQGPTVAQALADNNQRMTAVMSALKEHGVQKRDLETTQFTVDVVWQTHEHQPATIEAYRASNAVTAKLRFLEKPGNLEAAGATIDAAVKAGGDASRLQGISFSIEDPAPLLTKARAQAVEDAQAKARQLTDGAGIKLGEVITISESQVSAPESRLMRTEDAAAPIAPGEQEVMVMVTIDYELLTRK